MNNRQGMMTTLITTAVAGAAIYGITRGVQNGTFQRLTGQFSNLMNNPTVQQMTNPQQNIGNNQSMQQQLTNAVGGSNTPQQAGNNLNNE
ncbi:hypothetical protein CIL05_10815 [Virgibacillus profundi]|uniref:Uncharacterized protein n=1 Tax=Virgibacillus profundi TaxID=2024555 RepID=A0A2A2ICK0_9BACI|nr:hypothetical protein [Virgibacillus profundi]PAV29357.1 hypothetical protein CIL05_10815 [Virgibacillus profundi]PXY53526.1 hypothetical protein CIT14_10920 [Virgibacillus profundi]